MRVDVKKQKPKQKEVTKTNIHMKKLIVVAGFAVLACAGLLGSSGLMSPQLGVPVSDAEALTQVTGGCSYYAASDCTGFGCVTSSAIRGTGWWPFAPSCTLNPMPCAGNVPDTCGYNYYLSNCGT